MVNSVGSSTAAPNVAALNGQIRRDKQQLDDWTTCVSAKTTKGQAEIQRLSGEISAAREQVLRAQTAQLTAATAQETLAGPGASHSGYDAAARLARTRATSIDVWA